MRAPPLKPGYGPSLPELVGPHWRRLTSAGRRWAIAGALALVAAIVGLAVAWPRQPHFASSGPPAFSFTYPASFGRVAPGPGAFVRIQRPRHGRPALSFAVAPLLLPPYDGPPQGQVPLLVGGLERRLAGALPGFVFLGDGRARLNNLTGFVYQIVYRYGRRGHAVLGRDLLVLPDRAGARRGLLLVVHGTPRAAGVTSALLLGGSGDLGQVITSFGLD